jgi:protein-L-isoaspartate(D-aspartate) O-methyltransferase
MEKMVSETVRKRYAGEIEAATGIRSRALLRAFATVPREQFLGPAPWQLLTAPVVGQTGIQSIEVSDPERLYSNASVVLDPSRSLTNGNPGTLAPWLDALDLAAGDSVFHLGCGTGYYSALISEIVGTAGRVTAVEVDPKLASIALDSLAAYPNVEVIEGDGGTIPPGQRDAILINAGVTHPPAIWLDSLKTGGRLLVPLTVDVGMPNVGKGVVLLVRREELGYAARFLATPVMIFTCTSARDPNAGQLLMKALMSGAMASVRSLRRDTHAPAESCWLHAPDFCLSTSRTDQPHGATTNGN